LFLPPFVVFVSYCFSYFSCFFLFLCFSHLYSFRYHLGGPISLRGFDISGIGSKDRNSFVSTKFGQINSQGISCDSLGGDTKTSFLALLSVPVPIPVLAETSMRAFWFLNAGSLGNSNYWKMKVIESLRNQGTNTPSSFGLSEIKGRSSPMFGYLRASIGSGLSVCLSNMIRIETTCSLPIYSSSTDRLKHFQIGVSLSIN
jgi:outer membrane protein assembly factor BamA